MPDLVQHDIVTIDVETVETVSQLRNALDTMVGAGLDAELSGTYLVELIGERFGGNSIVRTINIRAAPPVSAKVSGSDPVGRHLGRA